MIHKYGFHVNRTGDDVFGAIQRLKPTVIKALDHNVDFWKRVRAIHPEVMLVGRLVVDGSEQERFSLNPAGAGRALAERILGLEANRVNVGGRPLFDAWESYNEIFGEQASPDMKRRYDEFQVAFYEPIKQAGFEPIAMNFGTGNMLGSDFIDYFPGTLEAYTLLGFHEYDWPTMWRLHEDNIRTKNEGGMWLTLRYRRIMRDVRLIYGDKHRALITECGMTQGVTGGDDVGWLHEPAVAEEDYWQSLLWYNEELLKDSYVIGALLYVVGASGGWPQWESFEHLGSIVDRLEAYQRQSDSPSDSTEPTPDPRLPDTVPVEGLSLAELLLDESAQRQVIQFNPAAALQRRIFADGFVPNSSEFAVAHEQTRYVAQRAEHLGSGEVRVYYVPEGAWDAVSTLTRAAGGPAPQFVSLPGSARYETPPAGPLESRLDALHADLQRLMRHLGAS